jgi:uncharacterized protein YcgL (UPF0745 family)
LTSVAWPNNKIKLLSSSDFGKVQSLILEQGFFVQ